VRTLKFVCLSGLVIVFGLAGLTAPAHGGTKYQTSLVPNVAGTSPGFAGAGSSIKIDGHRMLKGKIKKVVDVLSALVTTDGVLPSVDDYTIEVDLTVPATATSGTVTVPFDLKNGNGKFAADVTGDPVFAGAVLGDGVAVTAIRVKDRAGAVLGVGGVAIE
jgi:hypothetical protein